MPSFLVHLLCMEYGVLSVHGGGVKGFVWSADTILLECRNQAIQFHIHLPDSVLIGLCRLPPYLHVLIH